MWKLENSSGLLARLCAAAALRFSGTLVRRLQSTVPRLRLAGNVAAVKSSQERTTNRKRESQGRANENVDISSRVKTMSIVRGKYDASIPSARHRRTSCVNDQHLSLQM